MEEVSFSDLKKLYLPPKDSHKGENGKLTIVGGSKLFHGASLWALKVASRIVDMVFYASVPENNKLTEKLKSEIFDFIAIPREEIEQYIEESDCVLIGPGLRRAEGKQFKTEERKHKTIKEILEIENEGEQTYWLTKYLLERFPHKKWVIDAGSLQMAKPVWLGKNCLITPHKKEFKTLFGAEESQILEMAKKYGCVILLKGPTDIICSPKECKISQGGNAGMTKGGTGDVLAGLAAAFACKNDLFLAACAASFINKRAGEELFKRVGYYFNASDLAEKIPEVLGRYLRQKD